MNLDHQTAKIVDLDTSRESRRGAEELAARVTMAQSLRASHVCRSVPHTVQ